MGSYGPVAFVLGFLRRAFDLEPKSAMEYQNSEGLVLEYYE